MQLFSGGALANNTEWSSLQVLASILSEYCNATGIHWDTAKAHRVHRDEAKVTSCLMCACLILIATA